MKPGIFFGLIVALFASCFSVRANDTPAQAAARAALEQKLRELDNPQAESVPAPPLRSVVVTPDRAATNVSTPLPIKAVVIQSQPAPAPKIPVAVAVAPPPPPAPVKLPPVAPPARPKPIVLPVATKPTRPPVEPEPASDIVNIYGVVYKNAVVEKVQTNGLIISYSLPGGGVAMSKVYFEDLTYELRQQYKKTGTVSGPTKK